MYYDKPLPGKERKGKEHVKYEFIHEESTKYVITILIALEKKVFWHAKCSVLMLLESTSLYFYYSS